jgi:hypothetical protein
MFHSYLHLHVAHTRRTNRGRLETFQKAMFVHISGALYRPVLSHIFQTALPADGYATTLNGPQSADSNLAIVYLLPFTMNRAPPYATNRFIQLTAGTWQACSTCYLVPETLGIFGLHAGIMKFNIQSEG